MGVDARMEFEVPGGITDEQIRTADYDLASAVGYDKFFGRFGQYICMTRAEEDSAAKVRLHLSGRYYGKGYERGNLLAYLAIADWLERRFPGVKVYYGGDNSDELDLFNKAVRDELYEYWLRSGREPYERYFGEGPKGCELCVRPLVNCGGGGGDTFLRCGACGSEFVHNRTVNSLTRVSDFFKRTPNTSEYTP